MRAYSPRMLHMCTITHVPETVWVDSWLEDHPTIVCRSKVILNPPPPQPDEEAAAPEKGKGDKGNAEKGKGDKGKGKGKDDQEGTPVAVCTSALLRWLTVPLNAICCNAWLNYSSRNQHCHFLRTNTTNSCGLD